MQKIPAVLLVTILSFINWSCKSQKELTMAAMNRVILNKADTIYQFYAVKPAGNKIKAKGGNRYFWFKPDTILVTHSGFDGKLLHGEYKVFYPNKNLKEAGTFKYGLKTGKWKSWFDNGELQWVSRWHNGKKDGKFEEFDKNGNKVHTGYYNNDELSGYVQEYAKDSIVNKVLYKKGEPVNKISKTDSTSQPAPAHVQKK